MKLPRLIPVFLAALMLTACGAKGSSSAAPASGPASGGQAASIQYLGPHFPFGCGTSSGYYYLTTLDGGASLLRYVDYATRQDVPLCSQPNCAHSDEKCPAWFACGGTPSNVFATDEQVFVLFSGSPWDSFAFETYGQAALPQVFVLEPDGSNRRQLARFDAAEAFSSMPAADDQTLYAIVTNYGEGEDGGLQRIAAIDLATGEVKTDDSVQRRDMRIVGAAGRELVLESAATDTLSAYAAYNVDSGQLRELYNDSQPVSVICQDGTFFLLDIGTGVLRCMDLATGNETTLATDLLRGRSLEWINLVFVTDEGYVVQAHDNGTTCNFLIDKTGKTTKQELRADSTDPRDKTRTLNIFARAGGSYLVAPSRSYHTVKVPGPRGMTYGEDQVDYDFALISPADYWASSPNYQPVARLE